MITIEDMAAIIAARLTEFAMPIFVKGHIPVGEVGTEGRITITPKEDSDGKIFSKCFVEVNFMLRDIETEADIRLDDIERRAVEIFKEGMTGQHEGQWYDITFSRRSREQDANIKCHYIHIQVLFEILNV